jgi:hypothetical protein
MQESVADGPLRTARYDDELTIALAPKFDVHRIPIGRAQLRYKSLVGLDLGNHAGARVDVVIF